MEEEHHDTVLVPIFEEDPHFRPQMQKVPPKLRQENNQQDYEPLVISFGPYHHGKVELQLAEEFKPKALQMLVEDSGKGVDLFYNKVLENINATRSCYLDNSTNQYDDSTFAQMMLLDASFIISYIEYPKREIMCSYLGNWGVGQDDLLPEKTGVVKEFSPPRYAWRECLTKFWCSARTKQKKDDDNDGNDEYVERSIIQSFRSVTDLKAKGIHFRPSTADSLTSFEFESGYFSAQLKVPVAIVSFDTKVFFKNLIAYEMSAKTLIGIELTTYIEFMKSLIVNPKDVKELREKKILFTFLSTDEDVVKVYKEIGPCGFYYTDTFMDVKDEIQAHYNNKVKTWLAELIHTYFQNPWTAVALFAATFLLVLTFLQTYYSIKPSS